MCLGIPVLVISKENDNYAYVKIGEITKKINISMVPEVKVGDYVVLHAGFAISVINEIEAKKTFEMLNAIEKGEKINLI